MGDPRQIRRKYSTPKHPWQAERLEAEKIILGDYSLKNKKEIWRMQSILKGFTNQAKKLSNIRTEQAKKEKEQLMNRLLKLGLIKKNAEVDDVLGLTIKDIMNRRLQTLVYKMKMANTPKQARQFIVHGHVLLGDKKINVPSYLVPIDEESRIKFKDGSNLIGKFGKVELLEKAHAKTDGKTQVEKKEEKKSDEKSHAKNDNKSEKKELKEEKPKVKKTVKNESSGMNPLEKRSRKTETHAKTETKTDKEAPAKVKEKEEVENDE